MAAAGGVVEPYRMESGNGQWNENVTLWRETFEENENHTDLRVAYAALWTAVCQLYDGYPLLERTWNREATWEGMRETVITACFTLTPGVCHSASIISPPRSAETPSVLQLQGRRPTESLR